MKRCPESSSIHRSELPSTPSGYRKLYESETKARWEDFDSRKPVTGRMSRGLLTDVIFEDGAGGRIRVTPVIEIHEEKLVREWTAYVLHPDGSER